MNARIEAIVVAVPVHDEEDLLGACLDSIHRAVAAARIRVREVVVCVALDRCSDRSARIARRHGVSTVVLEAGAVGAARAAATARGLTLVSPLPLSRIWTAHTDADSVVPPHWLTHQVDLAAAGADLVIGTVRPRFDDLDEERVRAWRQTHVDGEANGHVHGANLGIRADVLRGAGGFPPLVTHEDVRVVERARAAGAVAVASDDAWVLTSGRTVGRAPDGYARYLRDDLLRAEGVRIGDPHG